MKSAVFDFKSINRIVNRQEQKAEFEAKNPVPDTSMYGWPYGVAVPFDGAVWSDYQQAWVRPEDLAGIKI